MQTMVLGLLACVMAASATSSSLREASPSAGRPLSEAEKAIVVANTYCGRHSLYLMLRLRGCDVSHADIASKVPVGADGSSLLQLRQAAHALGLAVEVYKCTFDDLARWKHFGVVALIDPEHMERTVGHDNAPPLFVGHYVTIVAYDAATHEVSLVDGSFGQLQKVPAERFLEKWTGYVIAPVLPNRAGTALFAAIVLGWCGVALWFCWPQFEKRGLSKILAAQQDALGAAGPA
jgi:hypothetical protein